MRRPQHGHRRYGWWTLIGMALIFAAPHAGAKVESQATRAGELEGAWRLAFSETIGPDGTRRPGRTHESLLVISDGYYSMNYAFGPQKSEYFSKRFSPTDAADSWRMTFPDRSALADRGRPIASAPCIAGMVRAAREPVEVR